MTPIRIAYPRALLEPFRALAMAAFPQERYAVLYGRRRGNFIRIGDIWVPEDQDKLATQTSVKDIFIYPPWRETALAIADSDGKLIVGDIHSHPWTVKLENLRQFDTAPSGNDWSRIPEKFVHAILVVHRTGRKGNYKFATTIKFWPWLPVVEVEVI